MKKILSLVLVLVMTFSMASTAFAADFKDTASVPQADAIDTIETLGIVNGYGNGIFGPNDTLTRAQLCTMLTRALYGDPIYTSTNQFKDVAPTHWANAYINTAYAYGLMAGYGGGYFGPEDEITYTQMAAVIMKALGYDCGKMSWPTGVNSMGHTLGLFENVKIADYNDGCTRAHAAQMIYNAFDLEYVNHKADYPVVIKGTNFLEDGLGFIRYEDVNDNKPYQADGHFYEAYVNLDDYADARKDLDDVEDIYVTNNLLTITETIYPVGTNSYKFSNSKNAKTYPFTWSKVEMYVNGEEIEDNAAKSLWFNDDYALTGSFDEDDNLIAIYVVNEGQNYTPASGFDGLEIDDKKFDERTSTVTYFVESDTYIISNKIACGFVGNRPTTKSITLDGTKYTFEESHTYVKGDFVVIYFDHTGAIAGHEEMNINDVYHYDTEDMIVHTWECDHYNDYVKADFWMTYDEVLTATDLLEDNKTILYFSRCSKCHAKDADRDMITIAPTAPAFYTMPEWKYFHATKDCSTIPAGSAVVTYDKDVHTGKTACPYCAH